MTLALVFWILMLLWLVSMGAGYLGGPSWSGHAGNILLFLLFLTLGWALFGAPVRG